MNNLGGQGDGAHRRQGSAEPSQLSDTDLGCFSIRTITGGYVLDLVGRRLARYPVTAAVGTTLMTLTFDVDGSWLPLVELTECRVGTRMRATVRIDGAAQPLRSSSVQSILRMNTQPGPGAGAM